MGPTRDLQPSWRRRRKPFAIGLLNICNLLAVGLMMYTLTGVLVLPWSTHASTTTLEGPKFNGEWGAMELGQDMAVALGGARPVSKRATYVREEQNGVVKSQNVGWNDSWVHHMSSVQTRGKMRRRSGGDDDEDEELRRRQKSDNGVVTVYLTFNTCLQPMPNATAAGSAPQLAVYVSNSTANKSPGPNVQGKVQYMVPIDSGFGSFDFVTEGEVYVGVYASPLPASNKSQWGTQPWNYELALSTFEPYHGYRENQYLYLVDTDDSTALLITGNMTATASQDGGVDELTEVDTRNTSYTPYRLFAQNLDYTAPIRGLEKSYCALRGLSQIRPPTNDGYTSMTMRGLGNLPKQQFHLKDLNRSSEYYAFLARPRNTSDTAGILWRPLTLRTKSDGNCQIIYNLPFCEEVAYAVPSNPTIFSNQMDLTSFYDDGAKNYWTNFSYSLDQVQCDAKSDATYSLVRNCDDCGFSYKNWLCAVTIPRCMDWTSNLTYLAERSSKGLFWNATVGGWQKHPRMAVLDTAEADKWSNDGGWHQGQNSTIQTPSRNNAIDEKVRPGAYKEIKPCKDLCWSLVQSCPSTLGFSCPQDGTFGKEMGYGERDHDGDITCSYLGAVYFLNAGGRTGPGGWWAVMVGISGAAALWAAW